MLQKMVHGQQVKDFFASLYISGDDFSPDVRQIGRVALRLHPHCLLLLRPGLSRVPLLLLLLVLVLMPNPCLVVVLLLVVLLLR